MTKIPTLSLFICSKCLNTEKSMTNGANYMGGMLQRKNAGGSRAFRTDLSKIEKM